MFPNDYEKVMKRHREERQRQREQERQKEIEEREKCARTDDFRVTTRTTTSPTFTAQGSEMFRDIPENPMGKVPI